MADSWLQSESGPSHSLPPLASTATSTQQFPWLHPPVLCLLSSVCVIFPQPTIENTIPASPQGGAAEPTPARGQTADMTAAGEVGASQALMVPAPRLWPPVRVQTAQVRMGSILRNMWETLSKSPPLRNDSRAVKWVTLQPGGSGEASHTHRREGSASAPPREAAQEAKG